MTFHASLIFLSNSSFKLFCYFCENGKFINQTEVGMINKTDNEWGNLRNLGQMLNNNGHGHRAGMKLAPFSSYIEVCYQKASIKSGRDAFLQFVYDCLVGEYILLQEAMQPTNITLNIEQDYAVNWGIQLAIAEYTLESVSNIIAYSRGSIIFTNQMTMNMVICVGTDILYSFDLSVFTVATAQIWMLILCLGLLTAFLYKNILQGLDILWPIVSISLRSKHFQSVLLAIMIPTMLLSIIYQGHLSSDSIKLSRFPTLKKLFNQFGYRLWTPDNYVVGLATRIMSKHHLKQMELKVGLKMSEMFLVEYNGIGDGNAKKSLEIMVAKRLAVPDVILHFLGQIIGNQVRVIDEKYYCKLENVLPIKFQQSFRVWSHLSMRVTRLLNLGFEGGLVIRVENLLFGRHRMAHGKEVNVRNIEKFSKPSPISFNSTLGISFYAFIICVSINAIIAISAFGLCKRKYCYWKLAHLIKRSKTKTIKITKES